MNVTHISIQLASGDPERLRAFYKDIVQLPTEEHMGPGAFKIGAMDALLIVDHSEVSGMAKEVARTMIDLHVEDIDAEHDRLKAAGVMFTREKGVEFWGGVISTFDDPDGNTIQVIQHKPELARVPEDQATGVA